MLLLIILYKMFLDSVDDMIPKYEHWNETFCARSTVFPGGVLPYIRYIGMCRPKGYGFWAVLVWKRV